MSFSIYCKDPVLIRNFICTEWLWFLFFINKANQYSRFYYEVIMFSLMDAPKYFPTNSK